MTMTLAPPICRRKSCTKVVSARALCKHHYDELKTQQEKAKIRAKTKELGEVPSCGLGILRCAVCGLQLSKHTPGQSCRGTLEDLI